MVKRVCESFMVSIMDYGGVGEYDRRIMYCVDM